MLIVGGQDGGGDGLLVGGKDGGCDGLVVGGRVGLMVGIKDEDGTMEGTVDGAGLIGMVKVVLSERPNSPPSAISDPFDVIL